MGYHIDKVIEFEHPGMKRYLPDAAYALLPDVLSLCSWHVHVQVTHVGFLRVRLQALFHPVVLRARQEGIGDEQKPWGI